MIKVRIDQEERNGNLDSAEAEELRNGVDVSKEFTIVYIKEVNDVAVEGVDDTSDTEDLTYHYIPIVIFDVPLLRILLTIYFLNKLSLFSVVYNQLVYNYDYYINIIRYVLLGLCSLFIVF